MRFRFLAFPLLAFLVFSPALPSRAEYRVFLLHIEKPATEPGQPPSVRMVESNLDPEQYRAYYPVEQTERITYVDTWRCRGRTDSKEYCPSPRAPAAVDPNAPAESQSQSPVSKPSP